MLASPVGHNKNALGSVPLLSVFLKHLNTGTLALALFVALAVLTTTRAKEPETASSAHARDTDSQLTITPCDTSFPLRQQVQAHKFTAKNFGNKVARNQ